jgi:hypothetical protein
VKPAGTVAAGCPVMLIGKVKPSHAVFGTNRPSVISGPCMCTGNGGTVRVGVSSRS